MIFLRTFPSLLLHDLHPQEPAPRACSRRAYAYSDTAHAHPFPDDLPSGGRYLADILQQNRAYYAIFPELSTPPAIRSGLPQRYPRALRATRERSGGRIRVRFHRRGHLPHGSDPGAIHPAGGRRRPDRTTRRSGTVAHPAPYRRHAGVAGPPNPSLYARHTPRQRPALPGDGSAAKALRRPARRGRNAEF